MREQAGDAKVKDCPKCGGLAHIIVPERLAGQGPEVFGCPACGHAFNEQGKEFIDPSTGLKDLFRGATLGGKALSEGIGAATLPPAAMVLLQAKVTTYGCDMWLDGLKQGLLLGAIGAQRGEKK